MKATMQIQIWNNTIKTRRAHLYILAENGAFSEGSYRYKVFCIYGELAPKVHQGMQCFPCADYIGYPWNVRSPPAISKLYITLDTILFLIAWIER